MGLIVLIVIVVAAVFLVNKSKNKKPIIEDNKEKKIDLEKTTSSVHISDDFKPKKSEVTVEKEQYIRTIYMEKADFFIWRCPNCEAENLPSKSKCCVCNYTREKSDVL